MSVHANVYQMYVCVHVCIYECVAEYIFRIKIKYAFPPEFLGIKPFSQ